MKTKMHISYTCVRGLGLPHACSLAGGSFSGNPKGFIFDSVRVPIFLGSLNHFTNSFKRLSKLYFIFGSESLYLSEAADGWGISDDSHDRLLSASITEYY